MHPPVVVPLTKKVDEMFDFFTANNARAAAVLNEFGGVEGFVTMKDVLTFIFGQISGDVEGQELYHERDEDSYEVDGDMKLTDFNNLSNFGIEDPRMTTIGGVAFRHLDRLPRVGDSISIEDISITVLEMDEHRIARVRVSRGIRDEETLPRKRKPGPSMKTRRAAGLPDDRVAEPDDEGTSLLAISRPLMTRIPGLPVQGMKPATLIARSFTDTGESLMEFLIILLVMVLLLLLKGFFSGSEIALVNSDKFKLHHKANQGNRGAQLVLKLFETPDVLLGTTLVGTNIATIVLTTLGTMLMIRSFGQLGDLYAVLLFTPLFLVLGEIVPKSVYQQKSNEIRTGDRVSAAGVFHIVLSPGVCVFPRCTPVRTPRGWRQDRAECLYYPGTDAHGGGHGRSRGQCGRF